MSSYGLIGESLKHSFSPMLHHEFGNADYELMEIPKAKIHEFMSEAAFKAINVTIPYKETVMEYCEVDPVARAIGSVNTIVNTDGKLKGYNTDYLGFLYMAHRKGIYMEGKKVVILGSGGTSKTACYSAGMEKAKSVTVVSRSGSKYDTSVNCPVNFVSYDMKNEYLDAQILINTTPVGMYPDNDREPVDIDEFKALEGVIDVIYNPLTTRLVQKAMSKNIPSTNGLVMLVAQAYYAGRHFFGKEIVEDEEAKGTIEAAFMKLYEMKRNLVLTGMPGSGKTTLGKALSKSLGREFIDTDDMFFDKYGIEPGVCIVEKGEEEFRRLETECVREASSKSGVIIATGGGVVLKSENIEALKQNGEIIYLHSELKNLAVEGRPLSKGDEKRKALYYKRLPIYLNTMDYMVEAREGVEEVVNQVMKALDKIKKRKYLIINGSNLNMLGIREPDIYGRATYDDLMKMIEKEAESLDVEVEFVQSNHEGDLVDAIQAAYGRMDGIVINPGAYTHTSVAILDAVKAVGIPTVEVHISDVDSREDFRQISYIRKAAKATISGHGFEGYLMALRMLCEE